MEALQRVFAQLGADIAELRARKPTTLDTGGAAPPESAVPVAAARALEGYTATIVSAPADQSLPMWMQGNTAQALLRAARRWWQQLGEWAAAPLVQGDALRCDAQALELLAWQRMVEPWPEETAQQYRTRVAFAYELERLAGSAQGIVPIFARLGLPVQGVIERDPAMDWDVITVRFDDTASAGRERWIARALRRYGRTCRRYQSETVTVAGQCGPRLASACVDLAVYACGGSVETTNTVPVARGSAATGIDKGMIWAH